MLMHEAAVAESLLVTILDEAAKQNAKPVLAKISCGTLNVINDDVLGFAFEAVAKDTACEGMRLEVEHKPIQGRCRKCKSRFDFQLFNPLCPKCGGDDFELLGDAPLVLETIEFETEQPDV